MIQRAVSSAFHAVSRPGPLVVVTLAACALTVANVLIGKPRRFELALAGLVLGVLRWALIMGIEAVALAMVRGEPDAASRAWVSPGKLLKLALIGIAAGVAGLVTAFVGTAVWLASRPTAVVVIPLIAIAALYGIVVTSQYILLILDDDGVDAIEAIALSVELTKEHRLELLGLIAVTLVLALAAAGAVGFAGHGLGAMTVKAALAALGVFTIPVVSCLNAAVYLELVRDQDKRLEHVAADLVAP